MKRAHNSHPGRKDIMNRQPYNADPEDDPSLRAAATPRFSSTAFVETSRPIVPRRPLFPSRFQVEEIEIPSSTDLLELRRTKSASSYENSYRKRQQHYHQQPRFEEPSASSYLPRRDQSGDERLYSARYGDGDSSMYNSNNRGYNRGGDDSARRRHATDKRHHGYEQSTMDLKPSPVEKEYYDESRGYPSSSNDRNDQDDRYYHSSKYPSRQEQDMKQSSYQHRGYSSDRKSYWEDLDEKMSSKSSSFYHEHQEEQQFRLREDVHQQQQQQQQQQRLIEVSPGLELPLYGAKETQQALVSGHMNYTSCMICQLSLYCIDVAKYVLCPSCLVVSPVSLEASDERSNREEDLLAPQQHEGGGVGFGMAEEEFLEYHRKNAQRNSRRPVYR